MHSSLHDFFPIFLRCGPSPQNAPDPGGGKLNRIGEGRREESRDQERKQERGEQQRARPEEESADDKKRSGTISIPAFKWCLMNSYAVTASAFFTFHTAGGYSP
jgi:hypothetical protein